MNNAKDIFRHPLTMTSTAFFVAATIFLISNLTFGTKVAAQTLPIFESFEFGKESAGLIYETTLPLPFLFYPAPIPPTENESAAPTVDLNATTQPIPEVVEVQPESPTAPQQPTVKPEIIEKQITAPKPKTAAVKTPKKIISAPFPYLYKKNASGQLVCSDKNDKPHKSTKGKGIHMDMECCLDPDETPNPHCYYPPAKYGKLLKKFN